jgi:hypothetical protein
MTQSTSSEGPITPIFVTLDICHHCFEVEPFVDYLKSVNRKEVFFLNPTDCIDLTRLPTQLSEREISFAVAKAVRTRIDLEITRYVEAKRRLHIQIERHHQIIAAAAARGRRARVAELSEPEEPRFEGRADLLFVILDFPYFPSQIEVLEDVGISLTAFLCFVPPDPMVNHLTQPIERTRKNEWTVVIPGQGLSARLNGNCYPPARWDILRSILPPTVPFWEITVTDEVSEMWPTLEREMVKILRAKEYFASFMESREIVSLPVCSYNNDVSVFKSYVEQVPGDYANGIWEQLRVFGFMTRRPAPPKTNADEYNYIVERFGDEARRWSVSVCSAQPPVEHFHWNVLPRVHGLFRRLIHFRPRESEAALIEATTKFVSSPQNLYAYAGARFDQLFVQINKKHQLGLPTAFFDWQNWILAAETRDASTQVSAALEGAGIIDSIFDDLLGVMWLMIMRPIPKTTGSFLANAVVPQTLEGISDWMKHLYDSFVQPSDKRTKGMVNPAIFTKGKVDPRAMLKPLPVRVDAFKRLYRLPLEWSNSGEFRTPYFFESGIQVEVYRNVVEGQFSFQYAVYLKNILKVQRATDSLVLSSQVNIRYDGSSLSIFDKDRSFYYDGEQLVLRRTNRSNLIISNNGTLILMHQQAFPMYIVPDGTISQFLNGDWIRVDESGIMTFNGTIVDRPHSFLVDPKTGTRTAIRPDNIKYLIMPSGVRHLTFDQEFEIEQSSNETRIILPNWPIITSTGNGLAFPLGDSTFKFQPGLIEQVCPSYSVKFADSTCRITCAESELILTLTSCQVRDGTQVLISTEDGTEALGTLYVQINVKKKVDLINTGFGNMIINKPVNTEPALVKLHHVFPARFFAIRSDFSAVEFIRPDLLPEMAERETLTSHPSQANLMILTRHLADRPPQGYIKNDSLSKPARSAVLKSLRVPKVKAVRTGKGAQQAKPPLSPKESIAQMLAIASDFSDRMNEIISTNHVSYLEDIRPPVPPPPEMLLVPPQPPRPRFQRMQHFRGPIPLAEKPNYWLCPESDFAYPLSEPKGAPRPLSSRRQLHDPPRSFKQDPPPIEDEPVSRHSSRAFQLTAPTVPMLAHDPVSPRGEVRGLVASPRLFDFGNISGDIPETRGIVLINTGTTPLRFAFSHIDHQAVKLLTVPGVIFPGLKVRVRVQINSAPPQRIRTAFKLLTRDFEMILPVRADIVRLTTACIHPPGHPKLSTSIVSRKVSIIDNAPFLSPSIVES